MGENTSEIFSGRTKTETSTKLYAETADFISNIIRNKVGSQKENLKILDVGTHKGELISDISNNLAPDYQLEVTGVDLNEDALAENKAVSDKIISDATNLQLKDNLFDISIIRYVLQWNNFEKQKEIIKEILRVTNGLILIEHAGPNDEDVISWRNNMSNLLSNNHVPKIMRENYFFSSKNEIESFLMKNNINFERLRDRRIEKVSNAFIERYNLSEEESLLVRKILDDKDYIYQTDWIIYK